MLGVNNRTDRVSGVTGCVAGETFVLRFPLTMGLCGVTIGVDGLTPPVDDVVEEDPGFVFEGTAVDDVVKGDPRFLFMFMFKGTAVDNVVEGDPGFIFGKTPPGPKGPIPTVEVEVV